MFAYLPLLLLGRFKTLAPAALATRWFSLRSYGARLLFCAYALNRIEQAGTIREGDTTPIRRLILVLQFAFEVIASILE